MKENKIEFFKRISSLLEEKNKESLKLSMNKVHHPGLFSLVINETTFGKLTRIFIANKKINPFEIQIHTHRYPIKLTAIKGNIKHVVALKSETDPFTLSVAEFDYKSPMNGGEGLKYVEDVNLLVVENTLPAGSSIYLSAEDRNTVYCSKDSMWIVEECGFKTDKSKVYGIPFETKDMYKKATKTQIKENYNKVKKEINSILFAFNVTK